VKKAFVLLIARRTCNDRTDAPYLTFVGTRMMLRCQIIAVGTFPSMARRGRTLLELGGTLKKYYILHGIGIAILYWILGHTVNKVATRYSIVPLTKNLHWSAGEIGGAMDGIRAAKLLALLGGIIGDRTLTKMRRIRIGLEVIAIGLFFVATMNELVTMAGFIFNCHGIGPVSGADQDQTFLAEEKHLVLNQ
jgi:hypothetical protein